MSGPERRIEPRLAVPMRVRYKVPSKVKNRIDIIDTTSQNIGLGGLMLVAHQELDKGVMLELEIFLQSSDSEPILAEGNVLWQSRRSTSGAQGRYDTGIKFRFVRPEDKRRFLDFTFKNQDRLVGLKRKKF